MRYIPIWEDVVTSDTVPKNYTGLHCKTAGTVVFKTTSAGDDISLAMTAGQELCGQVVLVKTTSTGTYMGAKA